MRFRPLERHLPKSRWAPTSLHISYEERRGALREILAACTSQEFSVSRVQIERQPPGGPGWEDHSRETEEAPSGDPSRQGIVTLMIEVRGAKSVPKLAARLSEIGGVTSVRIGDGDPGSD